ncbi:protein NCBP2AS2-like [Ylistrum balloti]|uniref:protein NCBP2AS2-like n=1 Tax=Ylistrum balloti TaxID=509963 RepID=UPI0029058FCF|nr:protein NCBP2AS2-like [Ylistrum balloti]
MAWRSLLNMILNNPQLIQKLSESPPIRNSARVVAGMINKARFNAEDKVDELKGKAKDAMSQNSVKHEETTSSAVPGSFSETFIRELKDGFKGLSEQLEREQELEKERQEMEEKLKRENQRK